MSKPLSTDERFDKLEAQLSSQFAKIDERFDRIDERFAGIDEQFGRIGEQFADVNKQLDRIAGAVVKGFERNEREHEKMATKEDVERIYRLIDDVVKRQEVQDHERLASNHQIDRLNGWVEEIAALVGYKLSY